MNTLSKDEIMALAREAGIEDASFATPHFGIVAQFERFAHLCRADLVAEIETLRITLAGAANYVDNLGGDSRAYRQKLEAMKRGEA